MVKLGVVRLIANLFRVAPGNPSQDFFGNHFLEFAKGSDFMAAVLAQDEGAIGIAVVEGKAVSTAIRAIQLDTHKSPTKDRGNPRETLSFPSNDTVTPRYRLTCRSQYCPNGRGESPEQVSAAFRARNGALASGCSRQQTALLFTNAGQTHW